MVVEKIPLGVSPHWYVNSKRIEELNNAIGRFIEYIKTNQHTQEHVAYYKAIAMWAREIETLALLEAELEKREKNNG